MQRFLCDCGNRLFFENTFCLACSRDVSWCPCCATMTALVKDVNGLHCARCLTPLWKCANRVEHQACNRSIRVPVDPGADGLCDCCSYNDTIPDLTIPGNIEHWRALEAAKRRLFYGLDRLKLAHGSAAGNHGEGLSFDFKGDNIKTEGFWRSVGTEERVFTGHEDGKITINIREADSVEREKLRVDLGEGHRTVIGHFRHEIGHYYWDVLVAPYPDRLAEFVLLFGDHNNPTYSEELERHYKEGPPDQWQQRYITAYASMHPWEDWAEMFAFYLDMVDVMEIVDCSELVHLPTSADFKGFLEIYVRLGILMNELNRSMGLMDFLPEVIAAPVKVKLEFVHRIIQGYPAYNQEQGQG